MIVIEMFPHWMVSTVDQSVAVAGTIAGTYGPHQQGVSITAQCTGPRYDRWIRAVREDDDATSEDIQIFVRGRGHTFEDAMHDVERAICEIEATPIPD